MKGEAWFLFLWFPVLLMLLVLWNKYIDYTIDKQYKERQDDE